MNKPTISEALLYFFDEKRVCLDVEFPDTGIDYAYMLQHKEWNLLSKMWTEFSDEWKTAITYFAGFAYLKDSGVILFKALHSNDAEIVEQALYSFYESLIAQLEEENHRRKEEGKKTSAKLDFKFSPIDHQKILTELELRKKEFKEHSELEDLKAIILVQDVE